MLDLQRLINSVVEVSLNSELPLNVDKTEYMIMPKIEQWGSEVFKCKKIQRVGKHTCLGTVVNEKMTIRKRQNQEYDRRGASLVE